MRPFLRTLGKCNDMISSDSPFWNACLNDPVEFIIQAFIPLLMASAQVIQGPSKTTNEYIVSDGFKPVPPETHIENSRGNVVDLQVIELSFKDIENGRWFSKPSSEIKSLVEFPELVFHTDKDWEYNGTRREFIYAKGTPNEHSIDISNPRVKDIASKLQSKTTTITPFYRKSRVVIVGLQDSDDDSLE